VAKFEQSVVVRRPVEIVFSYLANPENDPRWSSASDEMHVTSQGPVGVGTTVRQVGHFLGRRLELTLKVTVYELNQRFGMTVVSGPLRFAGVRHVEELPEGTRVTFSGGGESGGLFKLAEPLLEAAAARQLKRDLAKLKEVLEAPHP
jgi:uncharacterized membrane protein